MNFLTDPTNWLKNFFINTGVNSELATLITALVLISIVFLLSYLAYQTTKFFIKKVIHKIIRSSRVTWDDIFVRNKVFIRLSHIAPALIIWGMAEWALKDFPGWMNFLQKLSYVYMLSIGAVVINSIIESLHQIYLSFPISEHRHIKGYVQLSKIMVIIIIILIIVSVVFKKDVSSVIIGLGGMAAVLILIFQDTILGFVASIQISTNQMVKVGDWITIPSRGVDGDVIDMTLYTIKVQNFDKTIVTVPTHALIKESFQNWSGMVESGGRRIKRAIRIDMKSIRFLDEDLKNRLYKIKILQPYMDAREKEIKEFNESHGIDDSSPVNGRRMTNIGTFRAYANEYLKHHPKINSEMTLMIRHLPPDEKGLPLEIYGFTNTTKWEMYEAIQADIFDHLLAVIKEFDLKIFEYPSGEDLMKSHYNQ